MRAGRLVNLDFTLLLCTLAATFVGVLMVFSATNPTRTGSLSLSDNAVRQAIYGAIGLGLLLVIARLDYRFVESFTLPLYFVIVGLLGVVTLLGVLSFGVQRWH